jgi:hypothetical protein
VIDQDEPKRSAAYLVSIKDFQFAKTTSQPKEFRIRIRKTR